MRHEKRAKGSALRNASFSRVLFFSPLSLKKKKKRDSQAVANIVQRLPRALHLTSPYILGNYGTI